MSSTAIQPTQHVPRVTPTPSTTRTPDLASSTQNTQLHLPSIQSPAVANLETRKALLDTLSAAAKDSKDKLVDLKQTQFAVRANSSLGRELGQTDTTWRSLDWLINRNGWIMPTQASDLQNLHDAIAFAPLPQPEDRDFWGLLSRDIPLTPNQRSQVIQGVAAWVDKTKGGLLDNLEGISLDDTNVQEALKKPKQTSTTLSSVKTVDQMGFKYTFKNFIKTDITPPFTQTSTCLESTSTPSTPAASHHSSYTSTRCSSTLAVEPRYMLEHLLSQPKAVELGKKLEAELGVLHTNTSARELVMAALVLNLDPQAGNPRNTIGGFALDHPDNLGKSPETIMKALDDHLISNASVKDSHARAMSYLMLSRVAPQFLVKDLPDNLAYGFHQWATFSSAVARIEHVAPGSSATMSYKQVMDFGGTDPITEHDRANALIARRDALLDWAVTSGELTKRADGNYTKFEIQRAQRDFQEQPSSLVRASKQLSEQLPDRKQVALDDLKRVFGDGIDFTRKALQSTTANTEFDKDHFYSLLDVHMTGKLKPGLWRSIHSDFPMEPIETKCSQLKMVKTEFKNEFDFYYNSLRQGTNTLVRDLLSKLPAQDRHSLQHGTQTFYTVGKAVTRAPTHSLSKAEIDASQGKHGFIIRSEYESKITYYEVFPYKGEIQVRTDLPDELTSHTTNGGMALYQANARQAFDWQAYNSDEAPRPGEFSEVRIRELMPRLDWQRLPSDTSADLSFIGNKNKALADFAVTQFLLPDKAALWEQANGESGLEQTHRYQRAGADAALRLIPFATTLKHAINGDALKAINSFIIDGTLSLLPGSQGVRAFGHNIKNATKLFNILRKASRSTDDLVGLVASGKAAKSFYSTIPTFTSGSARIAAKNTAQGAGAGALLKTATNDMATGTVKLLGDAGEVTRVLAKFDGVDKWYPVDTVSGEAYGSPLKGFVPENAPRSVSGFFDRTPATPVDPDMPARFQVKVIHAKYGKAMEYTNGYQNIAPDTVPGYVPSMGIRDIETMIANNKLDAVHIGSLMRQRDTLVLNRVQADAEAFKNQILAVGGSTQGVPQTYYLSKTGFDLTGECAALSNAMGLALLEGNEDTLINNMAIAMKNPEAENSAKFISNLTNLQASVGQELTFHSAAAGNPVSYKTIIDRLGKAESSETLLVSSTNHGMLAGVKVDPVDNLKKSWFFYDPNYGLATFPTKESMAKGLEKALNSGTGNSIDAFGNFLTGKKYKISTFDAEAVGKKFNIDRARALSTPI